MKFGYVWRDPRAYDERTQRDYLKSVGCERIVADRPGSREARADLLQGDKPWVRAGDTLAVCRTRYLADDSVDMVSVMARLARLGALLQVIDLDVEFRPDIMTSEVTEADLKARQKAQTKAARDAWKKLPRARRGGAKPRAFSDEEKKKFRRLWAVNASYADIAEAFNCSRTSVPRYAAQLKLPPRREE